MGEHAGRSGRMLGQHRVLVHGHRSHRGGRRGRRMIAVRGERVLARGGRSRGSQVGVRRHQRLVRDATLLNGCIFIDYIGARCLVRWLLLSAGRPVIGNAIETHPRDACPS